MSQWECATPEELVKWYLADCKHEKVKEFKNSVEHVRTCDGCNLTIRLVKVYGTGGG